MTKIGLMVTAVAAILSATTAFAADENINAVRDLPLGTARLTVDFGAALGEGKGSGTSEYVRI